MSKKKNHEKKNHDLDTYIVSLVKRESTGLGFLLQQRESVPHFCVWELCKNGAAESTKKIHKGDLLMKVNDMDLTTVNYEKGLEFIKSIKPGSKVDLTLKSDRHLCVDSQYNYINNNKKPNGFMSPLIKIKKKISGACNNSTTMTLKPHDKNILSSSNQDINKIQDLSINGRLRQSSQPDLLNTIHPNNTADSMSIINKYLNESDHSSKSLKNLNKIEQPLNHSAHMIKSPNLSLKSSDSNFREILIDHSDHYNNDIHKNEKINYLKRIHALNRVESHEHCQSSEQKTQLFADKLTKDLNDNEYLNEQILSGSIASNHINHHERNDINHYKKINSNCLSPTSNRYVRNPLLNQSRSEEEGLYSGIQIVQNGDEISINIDGKIEILTNRSNERKVISMSPSSNRRPSYKNRFHNQNGFNDDSFINGKSIEIEKQVEYEPKPTISTPVNEKKFVKNLNLRNPYNHIIEDKIQDSDTDKANNTTISNANMRETFTQTKDLVDGSSSDQRSENLTVTSAESSLSEIANKKVVARCPLRGGSESVNVSMENQIKSKKKKGVKLKYLLDESTTLDTLFQKSITKITCSDDRCTGSLMLNPAKNFKSQEEIKEEAIDFIDQFYASVKRQGSKQHKERLAEVIESVNKQGIYELKETELNFGARTAWRNASKCIGRIQWSKLQVFDARYVTTARAMFECICNHLKYVFNKGNIRSAITIFRHKTPNSGDFRVWNPQFLSYAGFKIDDQTVIGDRNQLEITELCLKLGWKPKYTEFEILPLVLQANGQDPEMFELPPELTIEVALIHPKYDWFKELNLKWYCVPGVSSMSLDVGGLVFTACPFNGWYMQTEIARDLADINRYNKLPIIAERMGLDTKTNSSLWKDKALLELNYSILYSFQKSAVTITDHHSASESFMKHYENENKLRGGCPADWVWVVPPMSSHLTPVFHLEMLNYALKPSYEYQEPPWKSHVWKTKNLTNEEKLKRRKRKVYFSDIARAVKFSAKLMGKALAKRVKCTILYATETGKTERFAKNLAEIFNHAFDSKVFCMNDYDVANLEHESLLLVLTSTFGNGDPPENGEEFKKYLMEIKKETNSQKNTHVDKKQLIAQNSIFDNLGSLQNVRYSVFGLGNSSYPKFCSFAKFVDNAFDDLGAECIYELGIGDELCGQEDAFKKWSVATFRNAIDAFCIDIDLAFIESISEEVSWTPQNIRLMVYQSKQILTLSENLSKLHKKNVLPCSLKQNNNLQSESSGRVTLCSEINTGEFSGELQYKPGDHIGIFATNRKELVDAILTRVTNAPPADQLVQIEILKEKTTVFGVSKNWIVDERYPASTLRTALSNYLDITSILTQNMLQYFSTQTSNDTERTKLESLAKDPLEYEIWRQKGNNLVDTLEEFPSLRPNASLLITQLPKLQPRFYSISSSPKIVADDIHITLGVVEYKPEGKTIRYGVCSKWLEQLAPGEEIPTFVRGAPSFRLPEDETSHIIMIGAGTGLAPFRSFWQERKIDKQMKKSGSGEWGQMVLYFGCRQSSQDELYKEEILQMVNEGVITAYHPAYSRDPNIKKTYVQDKVKENSKEIFDLIYNKNGHFYICGDVRMAADVTNTLEQILKENGSISLDDAKSYINEMKENLRFHEDIFGNSSSKF